MLSGRGSTAVVLAAGLLAACQKADMTGPSNTTAPATTLAAPSTDCGVECWAIKTLSDADSARVDLVARPTNIAALNALPARCASLPNSRLTPDELVTYEVVGRVTFVRLEDDRDFHVALADPAGNTIATEVADPTCPGAVNSPNVDLLRTARTTFVALGGTALIGQTLRVRGIAFYDFDHGQTGRSRSCLELHPVIAVDRFSS